MSSSGQLLYQAFEKRLFLKVDNITPVGELIHCGGFLSR